jgi:hypothetical protein
VCARQEYDAQVIELFFHQCCLESRENQRIRI